MQLAYIKRRKTSQERSFLQRRSKICYTFVKISWHQCHRSYLSFHRPRWLHWFFNSSKIKCRNIKWFNIKWYHLITGGYILHFNVIQICFILLMVFGENISQDIWVSLSVSLSISLCLSLPLSLSLSPSLSVSLSHKLQCLYLIKSVPTVNGTIHAASCRIKKYGKYWNTVVNWSDNIVVYIAW